MSGKDFAGKVAIVTGAGSGIGRAASRRLAAQGAQLVVADIAIDQARRTVQLIEDAGGEAIAVRADISSEDDNRAMFDVAADRFGGIDHAFLNAGILQPYIPFEQVGLDLFDQLIGVNLRGTFMGVQQALARLRPRGSCVVTASLAAQVGFAEAAAYSISKHGLIGLVRSAAGSFAGRGLRINAICPGMVLSGMTAGAGLETLADPMDLPDPSYRGGLEAQHVAEAALFLLGRGAAGINGQAQNIDAAFLAAFPPLSELQ